jgi:hypothetical protein
VAPRLRLVVLGMMGYAPYAGQAWLYLNWLRGLAKQGHEVWYVEDEGRWPYDPDRRAYTDDCSYAVAHIERCMRAVGLEDRWAFRFRDGEGAPTWGLSSERLDRLYRECDALLNVVGATMLQEEHMAAPLRVFVETDPVLSQLRMDNGDPHTHRLYGPHDVVASYGENYGAPDCGVPLDGMPYLKTRQPIDTDLWPATYTPRARRFTTIGNYRITGYDVEWRDSVYSWSKHLEWEKFLALPRLADGPFEMAAMHLEPEDRRRLENVGWRVVSPIRMSLDPFGAYQEYIQRSAAEFTVAKDQNVRLRSGWFSERDACYLASGKPVVAQDTGFGCALPTGEGLFAVRDVEEAAEAVAAIRADYRRHARAARAIAEEHFEAGRVAARLLADVGLA